MVILPAYFTRWYACWWLLIFLHMMQVSYGVMLPDNLCVSIQTTDFIWFYVAWFHMMIRFLMSSYCVMLINTVKLPAGSTLVCYQLTSYCVLCYLLTLLKSHASCWILMMLCYLLTQYDKMLPTIASNAVNQTVAYFTWSLTSFNVLLANFTCFYVASWFYMMLRYLPASQYIMLPVSLHGVM